jgi:predicted porin
MTKKLLPTMIGIALAGGMAAAQADVTVFGHIDQSVVNWDNYQGNGGNDTNFICTTCSIGFKGSEDLGNGLKAIFSIDFQYDMDNRNTGKASAKSSSTTVAMLTTVAPSPTAIPTANGSYIVNKTVGRVTSVNDTSSITDRDQWLGLAGNFGQVRVGTISTTYKSHGAMLDPGYRTSAQMRDWGIQSNLHRGAGEEGQGRATNTMRYDSPSWNGLKVAATYTLDSNENDGENDNPYGAGIEYSNGGLLVFADYITNDRGGNDDAYKAGAKYTMDNFSVFGQYEVDGGLITDFNRGAATKTDGADVWMLGGSFTMGNNTIYGAYAQGDNAGNRNSVVPGTGYDTGYDAWEVVGVHSMSKQTLVYLGYVTKDPDAKVTDSLTGLRKSVNDEEAWALGMKHKF